MISTSEQSSVTSEQTDAAAGQVARAAYAVWINQPVRNVADALAVVAVHATDPVVREWAAGEHPRAVLETLEADFLELAAEERRATLR